MLCLLAILGVVACTAPVQPAAPPDLLTPEQYLLIEAEDEATARGEEFGAIEEAPQPEAPRIVIDEPDLTGPVASPFPVRARFEAARDAVIVPETFVVRYKKGFVSLDITEQALRFMQISATGATANAIPVSKPGRHTLILEITDSERRVGRTRLTFEIAKPR